MNPGASAFLIFLFIVGAFAGLGYLVPEMNQRAIEIQELTDQNHVLKAELTKAQHTVQVQQATIGEIQARILELEQLAETERHAKEETLANLHKLQMEYNEALTQITTIRAQLEKRHEEQTIHTALPGMGLVNANYEGILPWLPPVFFLALAGGYGFHRVKITKTRDARKDVAESASSSEKVTVQIPRERIPEFVKWLRQSS